MPIHTCNPIRIGFKNIKTLGVLLGITSLDNKVVISIETVVDGMLNQVLFVHVVYVSILALDWT